MLGNLGPKIELRDYNADDAWVNGVNRGRNSLRVIGGSHLPVEVGPVVVEQHGVYPGGGPGVQHVEEEGENEKAAHYHCPGGQGGRVEAGAQVLAKQSN